jgi:DNA-binding NarL/FixJ family response regulator
VIRVAIVAASPLARAGLAAMLPAPAFEIIASVPSLEALEESLEETDADAIVLDWSDGQTRDPAARARLSAVARETPVVLLQPDVEANQLSQIARSANTSLAHGNGSSSPFAAVLPNNVPAEQLRAAINAVAAGLVVAVPQNASVYGGHSIVNSRVGEPSVSLDIPEPLTPRERQVLQMLASGLANKEIAAKLNISDHTAKFHVAAILGKLGAATRTEAVTIAIRHGLILL